MRVLILGGYGNFGARIARRLARNPALTLLIAGRDIDRARRFVDTLASSQATAEPVSMDIESAGFSCQLGLLRPNLVIHTCGPFQARDYRVAEAAIAIGSHYLDLADGRDFVAGMAMLDAAARTAGVRVISGASTVPALTAAVLDRLCAEFSTIDRIEIGISPGNQTERGLATVGAILGYVGAPIQVWQRNRWQTGHGWQSLRRHRYPAPMGRRWLALCDVPDLALFPSRYRAASVEFRAGLELSVLHLGLWLMSWLRRLRLAGNWARLAGPLLRASQWLQHRGSDIGGMHVEVQGRTVAGNALCRGFTVVASRGDGPEIPSTPAVLLANRLAAGLPVASGAGPCLDLFDIDAALTELSGFAIDVQWYQRPNLGHTGRRD